MSYLNSQLNKVEEEMTDIKNFNDSVIMTIPSICYINGGMILGEIGNIHRFSSPSKLLAFAGLDPSVYQSGNFQTRRTKMSKRGSKVLRYALINSAYTIVKNNATFKVYYDGVNLLSDNELQKYTLIKVFNFSIILLSFLFHVKIYNDIKMAEGRTHYNALGHCAGKLVRVIWKMITNDLEFNLH